MLMLEGLALALCTAAAGIVIGIALFVATAAVLNQFKYELSYHLYLLPFITTAVLGIAVILITYRVFLRRAFRGAPLEKERERGKRRKNAPAPPLGSILLSRYGGGRRLRPSAVRIGSSV